MEIVAVLIMVILLLGAYLRGRSNGYHDGYFKGHSEGLESAKIEAVKRRYSSAETVRIANAAFRRGYRKGIEEVNEPNG